jgi:hypothetical protein
VLFKKTVNWQEEEGEGVVEEIILIRIILILVGFQNWIFLLKRVEFNFKKLINNHNNNRVNYNKLQIKPVFYHREI